MEKLKKNSEMEKAEKRRRREERKQRIYDIIQIGTQIDIASKVFDYFIVVMIVLNIILTFLQTFEQLKDYQDVMRYAEQFTIFIFIIEYALRLYTSDLLYPEKDRWGALIAFILSFYGIVDLLTIISYFSLFYSNGAVALRMIRAVRILRLFKVNKTIDAFNVVGKVLKETKNQIFSSLFMLSMLIFASSLCMYGFEHEAQPDKFNNAFSGIWWALSAVLTIGYGDIYPVTIGGKIVAIFISLLGVCAVAIPTGIISAGFVDYYSQLKRQDGVLTLSRDINNMLRLQAAKAGLNPVNYMETLILEKEKERRKQKKEEERKTKG